MTHFELMKQQSVKTDSKIVFLIMDGLGGIRTVNRAQTELELAKTPFMDEMAAQGITGRVMPVSPGITPGSAPAHFSLFGYDPMRDDFQIGRGVLEALGIDMSLEPSDIAIRGNFATVDTDGNITDRRAGRIPTETCVALCKKLQNQIKEIDGAEIIIRPGEQYRCVVVFRGKDLGALVNDTDPQATGVPHLPAKGLDKASKKTAAIANKFSEKVRSVLQSEKKANALSLRGFSCYPTVPHLQDIYQLNPACIAAYPLYRGVAKVVGMKILEVPGGEIRDEFECLKKHWKEHDFFFMHIKKTDSCGEDGNPQGKIKVIEEVDQHAAVLRALGPDVLVITGDHSTPPPMQSHGWHPVPALLWARFCGMDDTDRFDEISCIRGGLGTIPSYWLMELAMANAGKFKKFGA